MPSKLYVGNLAYAVSNDDLQQLFSQVGQVQSVAIITDKFSGQSKGFGFVEMANAEDAAKAIQQFNETELKGRNIKVNEAKPRESSFGGGGGGGNRRWRRRRWKSRPRSLVTTVDRNGGGPSPVPVVFLAHANNWSPIVSAASVRPGVGFFKGRPVGKTSQRTASPAKAAG